MERVEIQIKTTRSHEPRIENPFQGSVTVAFFDEANGEGKELPFRPFVGGIVRSEHPVVLPDDDRGQAIRYFETTSREEAMSTEESIVVEVEELHRKWSKEVSDIIEWTSSAISRMLDGSSEATE